MVNRELDYIDFRDYEALRRFVDDAPSPLRGHKLTPQHWSMSLWCRSNRPAREDGPGRTRSLRQPSESGVMSASRSSSGRTSSLRSGNTAMTSRLSGTPQRSASRSSTSQTSSSIDWLSWFSNRVQTRKNSELKSITLNRSSPPIVSWRWSIQSKQNPVAPLLGWAPSDRPIHNFWD